MAKGIIQKAGDFLGISKFGQGLATAGRVISGQTGQDIQSNLQSSQTLGRTLYAARQEKDPAKRKALLELAKTMGGTAPEQIDPGLNLTNKEVLGSAANVVLNVATPGAFKGGKLAVIGKNAALGGAFGAASGLEKNRSAGGVVGSTVGGAAIGGTLGVSAVAAKALKEFVTIATPKWLMDKAIRPTLDESRKALKYGQKSLGEELLHEGVSGGPEKLLNHAETKLQSLEHELQNTLSHPALAEARITKESIAPHLQDLMTAKAGTPGLGGDVKRIKTIFDSLPPEMTLIEANQMKRRIYNELRDISYKLDAKLSVKGQALKMIAKGLKTEIENAVGGTVVQDINKKLSIYGKLEDRIVDQMARSMRNNSFGLTDAILTAGGLSTMNPAGILGALAASGFKHAAGSTAFRTTAAKGLNKLQGVGTGRAANTIKGTAKRAALNLP